MEQIYVLELEGGKYYVGKTKNANLRIGQHFDGDGSEWTKLHKPLNVIDIKTSFTIFDEENITIAYMREKGIYNVRGGIYCRAELSKGEIDHIQKVLLSIDNKCYNCGGNHYVKECNVVQNLINDETCKKDEFIGSTVRAFFEFLFNEFDARNKNEKNDDNNLKKDKILNVIRNTPLFGGTSELNKISNKSNIKNEHSLAKTKNDNKKAVFCTKCGRKNHNENNCYAKRDTKGHKIK